MRRPRSRELVDDAVLAIAAYHAHQNAVAAAVARYRENVLAIEAVEAHFFGFAGLEGAVEQGRAVGAFALLGPVKQLHAHLAIGLAVHQKHLAFVAAHHVHALGQQQVVVVQRLGQGLDAGLQLAVEVFARKA